MDGSFRNQPSIRRALFASWNISTFPVGTVDDTSIDVPGFLESSATAVTRTRRYVTNTNPNQERLDRMRQAMEDYRLDALVVCLPENVLLLSGFWPMIGATVLVFPLHGPTVCVIPHCFERESSLSLWEARTIFYRYGVLDASEPASAVRDILRGVAQGQLWKRVGFEGSFEHIAPSWNSAEVLVPRQPTVEFLRVAFADSELVDASNLLQQQRGRKTSYEIAKLRDASEISCIGIQAFESMTQVGIAAVELVAEVERAVMVRGTGYHGASRVRAFAQVAAGREESSLGFRPSEIPSFRRLEPGDVALLELAVVADGYWADRSCVRLVGDPVDEQVKIFQAVRDAQEAAIRAIRVGAKAADVDEAARSIIREAGYNEFYPHITGHGLGFAYHEDSPRLTPDSTELLEEGMLTSVEPGVYHRLYGGFRLEDDVLVKTTHPEVLGPFRKALM
jgi:Xaa-Pro dipeptidase